MGEEEAARRFNEYDGLCGEMVFMNAGQIREITTSEDIIELAIERAMKGINKLEESSGMDWVNPE